MVLMPCSVQFKEFGVEEGQLKKNIRGSAEVQYLQ